MIEMKYYFKDESGRETETRKKYAEDVLETAPSIELMMIGFKIHLKNCGFSEDLIKEFAKIHFK
jgi:hypothetical protein